MPAASIAAAEVAIASGFCYTPGMHRIQIGGDLVDFSERQVKIRARHAMEDWEPAEFCRLGILIEGQLYYVLDARPDQKPYAVRYTLRPWEDEQQPTRLVNYDAGFVQERDRESSHRTVVEESRTMARILTAPLYPFLGYLWRRTRRRVCGLLEYNVRTVSGAGLFGQMVLLCLAAMAWSMSGGMAALVGMLGAGALFRSLVPALLLVAGALDLAVRYSQLMVGRRHPDGFFEWLFRATWRRGAGSSTEEEDGLP